MSDYTKTVDFAAKDALPTGNANKVAKGAEVDNEFDNIAIAVNNKYDANDRGAANGLASLNALAKVPSIELPAANTTTVGALETATSAEATALSATDKIIVPSVLGAGATAWGNLNLGLATDLQALAADPAADRLFFFDDTDNSLKFLTLGANLAITGTTLDVPTATVETNVNHDNLTGFVAAEHIDWSVTGAEDVHVDRIAAGAVTQHQAALSIAKSQFSDLAEVSQVDAETGTSTTGTIWTAQRVAQAIAALQTAAGAPKIVGAKVHDNSAQSISNTTFTAKVWDTEAYDTNSYHDNITNNTRMTIPAGVTRVRLTAHILWDFFNGNTRSIKIRKNGVDGAIDDAVSTYQPKISQVAGQHSGVQGMFIDSGVITVAPGDYFEVLVWQNSGGNLNVTAYQSWFQIEALTA